MQVCALLLLLDSAIAIGEATSVRGLGKWFMVLLRRTGAAAIDLLIWGVLSLALGAGVSRLGPHSVIVALLVAAAVFLGVDVLLHARRGPHAGQSLGKQILQIRVIGADETRPTATTLGGRAFVRWFTGVLASAEAVDGLARPRSVSLHDRMLGTSVVDAPRRSSSE